MKKQKIIFLLGNGFSQGFGFPSMSELWDKCLVPEDDYYKNALEEAKSRYPLAYFIDKGIKEMELALTVWKTYYESHEEDIMSNAAKSGRGNFEDYIENMCAWLHQYTIKNGQQDLYGEVKLWLKEMADKYEIAFITTNYDLLIERIILDNSQKYYYLERTEAGSMPIRKIHGSISWFSSSHGILRSHASLERKAFFKGKEENSHVYNFTEEALSYPTMTGLHMQLGSQVTQTNVTPITTIIPPIVGKKYNELFGSIMQAIEHDFVDFDYFVMIGYSFPEADPIVKENIVDFCNRYKVKNGKIIAINNNQNDCGKIKELFGENIQVVCEKWSVDLLRNLLISR